MQNPRWRKRRITGEKQTRLIADLKDATPFKNYIKLVLSLMQVRRVFLTGLERVQSGKEEVPLCQCALAHLFRVELREAGEVIQEHIRHSISASRVC